MGGNNEINQFANNEFYFNVANGTVPGYTAGDVFGRNMDVDTASTPEDIWIPGALWVPPPSAAVVTIVSDSAADTAAGTGARTVEVQGLDANLLEQKETVTLNGVSSVDTVNTYLRINRVVAVTAGSAGSNVGTITVTQATIQGQMDPGVGSTLSARYSTPSDKKVFIISVFASASRGVAPSGSMAEFIITQQGIAANSAKVYLFGQSLAIERGLQAEIKPPFVVDLSMDILFTVTSVTDNNTVVEAGAAFVLCEV